MAIQTVTPGAPLTITLSQGSFFNLTVPYQAAAKVYRTGADGTPVVESIVSGPVTTKIGPHLSQVIHVIEAIRGSCTVEDTTDVGGGSSSPFAPGAPTIGTATVSGSTVSLPFTAPANSGASAILDYQAVLVDGSTLTVSASPAPFPLKAAGAYVGAVRARNASGYGPYSAQSNAVTVAGGGGVVTQTIAPDALTVYAGSSPSSTLGGLPSRTLVDGSTNTLQGTIRIAAGERWEVYALIGGTITSNIATAAVLFVGQDLFTDGNPTPVTTTDREIMLSFPAANVAQKFYIGSVEGNAGGYAVPRISRQGAHSEDLYTGVVHILGFEYRKTPDVVTATVSAPSALAMATFATPTLNGIRYNAQMAGMPMITSDATRIVVTEPVVGGSSNATQQVVINASTRAQIALGQVIGSGAHDTGIPGHNTGAVAIDSAGNLVYTANGHHLPLIAKYAPNLDVTASVSITTPGGVSVNSSYRKFYINPYNQELWLVCRANTYSGVALLWDPAAKTFSQKTTLSLVRSDSNTQGGTYGGQMAFKSASENYIVTSWIKWGLGVASGYPQRNLSLIKTTDDGVTYQTMLGYPVVLPMMEGHDQVVAFPSQNSQQNALVSGLVIGPDGVPVLFANYQHQARSFREMWMAKWNPTTQVFDRKMLYPSRGDFSVGQGDAAYDPTSGRIALIFSEVEDYSASSNSAVIPPAYTDCNMICLYSDDSGATFQRRVLGSPANWSGGVIDAAAFQRTGGKLLRMALRNHTLGTAESNYYEATLP